MAHYIKRKGNSITRLLSLPDKGVNNTRGVGGVLSRLLRQILWDMGISAQAYGSLMTKFVEDPSNGIPATRTDRAGAIGNYNKEFAKPELTWKKMVEAQKLLQFEDCELILRGRSRITGKVTEHSVKYHLGTYDEVETNEGEEEDE